jgi:hypothetical protein
MKFRGELRLDFEIDDKDLILNSKYKENEYIDNFLRNNTKANNFINKLFGSNGLTYNDFFEMYFGVTVIDDLDPKNSLLETLFFRPLNNDRKPIASLNFSTSDQKNEIYLENFDSNNDEDNEWVKFIYNTPFFYTETAVEVSNNKNNYAIITDLKENKIYHFMEKIKNGADYIAYTLSFDNNNGYKFTKETDKSKIISLQAIHGFP